MADYYNFQQLAQMFGIAEASITELQGKGFLQPTVKNGRSFLSSQQAYRLRVAIRWADKNKIDLLEAFERVEKRWLAHANTLKD
jgi:phage terminase Nu1 subunit (DNA packaging protein)